MFFSIHTMDGDGKELLVRKRKHMDQSQPAWRPGRRARG
jgi:hypothetical protein